MLVFVLIAVLSSWQSCHGAHKHFSGVAHINSKAFEKVIPRFDLAIVKFDQVHSMGQTQKAFKEVADFTVADDDMLAVEVCVEDKGVNNDLMEKFELRKRELPAYVLFLRGRDKPIYYFGDILRANDIISFVKTKSQAWFEYPAFMEKFDEMVEEFFESKPDDKRNVMQKADNATSTLEDEVMRERALIYVDTMRDLLEYGEERLDEAHAAAREDLNTGAYEDFLEKQRMEANAQILNVFVNRRKTVQLRKRAEEL